MCFCKTRQSKILIAKRDIVVYKIGTTVYKNTFVPYFINSFVYTANNKYRTFPNFKVML